MTVQIIQGNALHLPIADQSVDLVCTSPPYFGLRSYTDGGEHYAGQLGSEATPAEFVDALIAATAEMMRVLKPSGSIWVNLGDKYSTGNSGESGMAKLGEQYRGGGHKEAKAKQRSAAVAGMQPKTLLGIPWRYALRCIDQLGLILRAEIIWNKPNGLPESVTDRVRRSHEQWFHFVKQPRYFSAVDEVREEHADARPLTPSRNGRGDRGGDPRSLMAFAAKNLGVLGNPLGKLPGSVWTVPTEPLQVPPELGVDHFAAFPTEWPRRIIQGWSPAGICVECGEGRRPVRGVDWSKVPHRMVEKRALTAGEIATWCGEFTEWCERSGVTRRDLDEAAGTSDMGGWWASRLPHRSQIPTPEQWAKIRERFTPPANLDGLVHLTRVLPVAERDMRNVAVAGRNRATGGGLGVPVMSITGYVCACTAWECQHITRCADAACSYNPAVQAWADGSEWPPPTRPAVVLDPFGGTGTTALVADVLGRDAIHVDLSHDYNRLARWRVNNPDQRARAARVDKPPPVMDGQLDLLGGLL